jgi:hypothetical protein
MPQEPAPADQIEATPEMVWAGLDAYLDYGGQDSDDLMVAEIYRAMAIRSSAISRTRPQGGMQGLRSRPQTD